MNREESDQLASSIAQTLLEREAITFKQLADVKIIIGMELYKELVKPLEKVCMDIDMKNHPYP